MKPVGLMLRLPLEMRDWIQQQAKSDDRSMNWTIISILKDRMERQHSLNEKTPIGAGKQ